jgi:hypothetical protein
MVPVRKALASPYRGLSSGLLFSVCGTNDGGEKVWKIVILTSAQARHSLFLNAFRKRMRLFGFLSSSRSMSTYLVEIMVIGQL